METTIESGWSGTTGGRRWKASVAVEPKALPSRTYLMNFIVNKSAEITQRWRQTGKGRRTRTRTRRVEAG